MTALETLESLLETVLDERATIESQMRNIYPTPGSFAYNKAKPNETTQFDPSAFPRDRSMQIETTSVLQGQLYYNGQVQDHIKRLITAAKK